MTGPVLGGVITEKLSWRWIYLLNAPPAILGSLMLLICWPLREKTCSEPMICWKSLKQVDWLGAVLIIAASTLLVFALQCGSTASRGSSLTLVSTLIISGLCWVGFFVWLLWLSTGGVHQLSAIISPSIAKLRPTGYTVLYSVSFI